MSTPVCPIHQRPMKQWSDCYKCTAKVGSGYCNERAPLESAEGQTATTGPAGAVATVAQPTTTALQAVDKFPAFIAEIVAQYINNPAFELLLPSIPVNLTPNPWFKPSISIVQLDPEEDAFKVGYKDGQDVFAYGKSGLDKLSDGAGISFSGMRRIDDRSDPDYCEYVVTGRMRSADGEMREIEDGAEINMLAVEADEWRSRVAANERAREKKSEDELQKLHRAHMSSFRRYMTRRCMTAARERVVRALLSIKGGLTRARVAKPKVTMRVVPDASNPVVGRQMIDRGNDAARALYGPGNGSGAHVVEPEDIEPIQLGNAPVEDWTDPDEPQFRKDIAEAAEVLNWTPEMAQTLIAKHNGNIANARKEIVGYVDRMGVR